MADGFTLTIKGLQELQTFASTLPTLVKEQVTTQVNAIFDQGVERMNKDVPVRTGNLKRSIKKSEGNGTTELARIDITAPYAGFVEFGTFRQRPRNYVTPNVNFMKEQLQKMSFK